MQIYDETIENNDVFVTYPQGQNQRKTKNMQENIQEINIFTEYLQQVLYC